MSAKKRKKSDSVSAWLSLPILGGVVALILYVGVYRPYRDFKMEKIDAEQVKTQFHSSFPGLETAESLGPPQKEWVVQKANKEMCPCGCGYTLAACLKSDEQCPVRSKNLKRVQELIQTESKTQGKASLR